jgi:hypothetical protein
MLDDLRNAAAEHAKEEQQEVDFESRIKLPPKKSLEEKRIFGMTASQRFVLVLMVFLMTCLLGVFFLIITESVYLPIF